MTTLSSETLALLNKELSRDEGRRNRLYKDTVGKWTIGIGRNLSDKPISDRVIDILFEEDVEEAIAELDRVLPWWASQPDSIQRVLVNMMFNMGANRLLGFKNTLKAIEERRYLDAARGMRQSLWAKQVGQRAERLALIVESYA